jgi:hypothetical protein
MDKIAAKMVLQFHKEDNATLAAYFKVLAD